MSWANAAKDKPSIHSDFVILMIKTLFKTNPNILDTELTTENNRKKKQINAK